MPKFDRWIDSGFSLIQVTKEKKPIESWINKIGSPPEAHEKSKIRLKYAQAAAVICGKASNNLVILDCDDPHIGELLQLDTFTAKTPSGGLHYYVYSETVPTKLQNHNGYALDIQGERSYAIIPPSVIKNGTYSIINDKPIKKFENIMVYINEKLPITTNKRSIDIEKFKQEIGTDILKNWVPEKTKGHGYWQGLCPFHNESEPSFTVYRDSYKCFGCGEHGDIINFVMENENKDFKEAIQILSNESGVEIPFMGNITQKKDSFSFTDYANARRVVAGSGEDIRYCHAMKNWYIWNGKIWKQDDEEQICQIAKKSITGMYLKAASIEDPDQKRKVFSAIIGCENQNKLKAMIESATNEPEILLKINEMDNEKDLLCVKNGIVDLKEGKLLPHSKESCFTRYVDCDYKDVEAPLFKSFLERITDKNVNLMGFLQRFLGYSLTGRTDEQVFCIFQGRGANGKGTLLDTILDIIGDFGTSIQSNTIVEKKYDNAPTNDIAELKGRRLVVASETKANQVLDEGLIKKITGQERVKCRFLYKELFEYVPEFKLILATNHEPIIKGQDHSIWRRVLKVPFNVVIPKAEWDLSLRANLLQEKEGILKWLVDGAVEWYANGLDVPQEVKVSTDEYKNELDILGDFIEACLVRDIDKKIAVKGLYEIYSAWSELNNNGRKSSNSFSRLMNERGFNTVKTHGIRYKKGVSLQPELKDSLQDVWGVKNLKDRLGSMVSVLSSFHNFSLKGPHIETSCNGSNIDPIDPIGVDQQEIMEYINKEIQTYTPTNHDFAVESIATRIIREYGLTNDQAKQYISRVFEDNGFKAIKEV